MEVNIKTFVRECDICQRVKAENVSPAGLLQPLPIPKRPWYSISMDFIEGLLLSKGHSVVWGIVDGLTKYVNFLSLAHPYTTSLLAQLFVKQIFKLHGLPNSIILDSSLAQLSLIHPVFYVSQLKNKLGTASTTIPTLPPIDKNGVLRPELVEIFECRSQKKNNRAVVELLVRWHGQAKDEASWETFNRLKTDFGHLAGKLFLNGWLFVTSLTWRRVDEETLREDDSKYRDPL
jgi:hypothetical protein